MQIQTESGILDTEQLPDTYTPCHCAICGCRLGWIHEETDNFIGLCDACAALVAQGAEDDPMG